MYFASLQNKNIETVFEIPLCPDRITLELGESYKWLKIWPVTKLDGWNTKTLPLIFLFDYFALIPASVILLWEKNDYYFLMFIPVVKRALISFFAYSQTWSCLSISSIISSVNDFFFRFSKFVSYVILSITDLASTAHS